MLTRAQRLVRTARRRIARAPVAGVALEVQQRYGADNGGALASTITYHAFLSLFPLLLLGLAVIGFVVEDAAERARWLERLSASIPGLRPLLGDTLTTLAEDRAAVGLAGLLSLAWTGTGVVRAAGTAVSRVFGVPTYPGWKQHVWALGTLVLLGALMLGSIAAAGMVSGAADGRGVGLAAAGLVTLALDFVLFAVSYRQLTQRRGPAMRNLWAGALLAAIGWASFKVIGVWYATKTLADAQAVYGAFAATVGVLVVLSLMTRLFLYGAELNAVLFDRRRGPAERKAVSLDGRRRERARGA